MLCAGTPAYVLLAGLELIERRPPCCAAELRRWDDALCDGIALVERDDPQAFVAIYAAVVMRRAAPRRPGGPSAPGSGFRWRYARSLTGNEEAQVLVLALLSQGTNAAPRTAARWHAEWAARHLLPALALHECAQ